MVTIHKIIEAARAYIGTKFKHGGRSKNGIDCIGLIECSLHDAEILTKVTTPGYSRNPVPDEFSAGLDKYFDRVPLLEISPGDILWFAIEGIPRHVGFYTEDNTVIHAYAKLKKEVIEHRLTPEWKNNIRRVYRIRESDRV